MALPITNVTITAEHAGAMLTLDDHRFAGVVAEGTTGRLVCQHPNPELTGWLLVEVDPADVTFTDEDLEATAREAGVAVVPLSLGHVKQPRQTCRTCLRTVGTLPEPSRPWRPYRTEVIDDGPVSRRRLFHYCTDAVACQAHRDAEQVRLYGAGKVSR
jgi:hypothetical protein